MTIKNRTPALIIPILIGIISFFVVVGPKALNPINVDWLLRGESLEDYLAWVFYRRSPWSLPLGVNPDYGLDISSSIVYSDSIPLLAIFFKALSPFISETFQYFGIWLLVCFIFQGIAAWLLVGLVTNNLLVLVLSTALFIFSPSMLWRIEELQGALVGHFLILFAIYLNLRPKRSTGTAVWCLLLCTSILAHFYIFAMVLVLWGANFLDSFFVQRNINIKSAITELISVFICLGLTTWQAGYFLISGGSASEWGYGQFNFNLLSIFYSRGWSNLILIKDFIKDFESFNYLGLGILVLLIISIPMAFLSVRKFKSLFIKSHIFFWMSLGFLMIFAISNSIDFGRWSYVVEIPGSLLPILNIVRHSNRFFWPVYYSALLFSIYCLVQIKNKKILYLLLVSIFCLQIYDTQAGWGRLRGKLMWPGPPEDGEPLQNEFWKEAAKKYQRVVRVPISHKPPQWGILARYAAEYHLATNSASFARVDRERLSNSNVQYFKSMETGIFEPNTLYIIDQWKDNPINIKFDPNKDLLARIDGLNVLAPGWRICEKCEQVTPNLEISRLAPPTEVSKNIYFRRNDDGRTHFLLFGWSWPGEDWGTWSDQDAAKIILPLPDKGNPRAIRLNLRAFITNVNPSQSFRVLINGIHISSYTLTKVEDNYVQVPIPASELSKSKLEIEFVFSNATSPVAAGLGNGDSRRLAVGLKSLAFE